MICLTWYYLFEETEHDPSPPKIEGDPRPFSLFQTLNRSLHRANLNWKSAFPLCMNLSLKTFLGGHFKEISLSINGWWLWLFETMISNILADEVQHCVFIHLNQQIYLPRCVESPVFGIYFSVAALLLHPAALLVGCACASSCPLKGTEHSRWLWPQFAPDFLQTLPTVLWVWTIRSIGLMSFAKVFAPASTVTDHI